MCTIVIFMSSAQSLKTDLHGMNRWQALEQLSDQTIKLFAENRDYLLVIHGHHGGTVLRDQIRTGKLQTYLRMRYPLLPPIEITDFQDGATKISFPGRNCSW